jgi:hypothetical protein
MDARTIARLRRPRTAPMTFRLAALDIEQHRTRVAIGVRCPGCGLLYLAGDTAVDPETSRDAQAEVGARLAADCPDHVHALTAGAAGAPSVPGCGSWGQRGPR